MSILFIILLHSIIEFAILFCILLFFFFSCKSISAKTLSMSEKSGDKKIRLDETLSLSEAAMVLKFDSFRSINELIRKKKLKSFRTPYSRNKRVLKSEVEALTIMEEIS